MCGAPELDPARPLVNLTGYAERIPTDRNRAVAALELPPERLCWRCDVHDLDLNSALDWPPPEGTIGQDRGVGALALGLALDKDGFNVYVAGPSGSGRTTTVRTLVGREAARRPSASDWCYVHRFDSPPQPIAIRLPSSRGPEPGRDLDELIAGCRREIPRVFEGEQYQQRRADIIQQLQNQREALLAQVRGLAARLGFAVEFSPICAQSIPSVHCTSTTCSSILPARA